MPAIISKNQGRVIVVYDESLKAHHIVPLFCPVCSFQMKTFEDSISYRNKKCCNKCEIYWGYKKEFSDNSTELSYKVISSTFEEEWEEYIKNRELASRPILIFK